MSTAIISEADVEALGVRTDIVTACRVVYGCGRTKAYELLRTGQLDFPVLHVGRRVVVPTGPLRALLNLNSSEAGPATGPAVALASPDQTGADNENTARTGRHSCCCTKRASA